jgi:hypothetical protein
MRLSLHPSPDASGASSPGPINTALREFTTHLGLWVPGSMLRIAPGMGVR